MKMELHVRRADLRLDLTMEEAAEIRDYLITAKKIIEHSDTPSTVYELMSIMNVVAGGQMAV